MTATKPKITLMGEEIDYDSLPEPDAVDLADHFKPVKLSPRAIDEASKIVPSEVWIKDGLHLALESCELRVQQTICEPKVGPDGKDEVRVWFRCGWAGAFEGIAGIR